MLRTPRLTSDTSISGVLILAARTCTSVSPINCGHSSLHRLEIGTDDCSIAGWSDERCASSTLDPSQQAQITAIACLFLASSFSRLSSLRACEAFEKELQNSLGKEGYCCFPTEKEKQRSQKNKDPSHHQNGKRQSVCHHPTPKRWQAREPSACSVA